MRWFILGLLFIVVLATLAMIRVSLASLRRRDLEDEEAKRLPPPPDEGQAPGHPDAATHSEGDRGGGA